MTLKCSSINVFLSFISKCIACLLFLGTNVHTRLRVMFDNGDRCLTRLMLSHFTQWNSLFLMHISGGIRHYPRGWRCIFVCMHLIHYLVIDRSVCIVFESYINSFTTNGECFPFSFFFCCCCCCPGIVNR